MINAKLEMVERGEIDRLMLFLPPRHGKSMDVSETFPSWFIGRNPSRRVIEVSYGDDLAQKFGYANKKKLEEFGPSVFGISLDPYNRSKTNWGLDQHRGGMISAGIGGPITGEGADLLLIDDPVKNRKEAESLTYREMVWSEWQNTLLTRLHPGGAVILIMTRWHRDDLAGRLLDKEGRVEEGGRWTVISLPAKAEENDLLGRMPGEPLWPEHGYDAKWLAEKEKEVGSYTWAALYQQRPKPRDGLKMFQRHWFEVVEEMPADAIKVRRWDLAATEAKPGKDPDYTAGVLVGRKDGITYIADMKRVRATPLNVERLVRQTAEIDGYDVPIVMEQEPGSSGKNTIDHYARRVLYGYAFRGQPSTGSKVERALALSAAAEAGNVKLVRGPWIRDFLDEIEEFPDGDHDDQVDVAASGFNDLARPRFIIV